ncbi:ABC transporter permease [Actinoplanes sp. RD1]|uniref:ABC transporter permease n=1 Tax=Actinoplanes sp. RD1 TaxID=3064538 RepID=UPI002741D7EE|nr:ABC transporter permease subunit [Actinoplanes sp. RD1]
MTDPVRTRPGPARLLGETVVIDDVGPGRRSRAYPSGGFASALLAPMVLLLGGILLWPVGRTVQASVTGPDGRWAGLTHFRTALAAEGTWQVLGRTVLWAAVVPVVVIGLGWLLAASRRRGTLLLLAPIALPLVVTGVMFRLFYDPDPARGIGTAVLTAAAGLVGVPAGSAPQWLGPQLITVALMSAFVWAWIGLPVVVFRAALDALPSDLADAVRAGGGKRLDVFRDAVWRPLLRRTAAIVFALVAIGTARAFDLILVMAPGSSLDEAANLAVRVWQTSGSATSGPAAALNTLWLAALGAGMVAAAVGGRQAWPPPLPAAPPARTVAQRTRWPVRRLVPVLVALLWAVPVLALIATSLHSPQDAATRGWSAVSVRFDSYRAVFAQADLLGSIGFTALLALSVTVLVLAVALPAAYALARLRPPGTTATGALLVVASAVPVQVVAGPINEVLARTGLAGTNVGLALVHVALGAPFAVLLLRNALADVPGSRLREARIAGLREWAVLWRTVPAATPAIVAVAVLEFVQVWNDFVVGLLFGGSGTPLGLLLFGQTRQFALNSGTLAAFALLASVPPLVAIVLARRQVIAGLVSGAVR